MVNESTLSINLEKARQIKFLLTDCDGVLTDGGVYYSDQGEMMKRFSMRDGMGVQRIRELTAIDVGIITGERSPSIQKRAEKLNIKELHLGIKDKLTVVNEILNKHHLKLANIAYIGDDTNDVEVMKQVGLSACPADATPFAKNVADYVCRTNGGFGAFREFVEFIITAKTNLFKQDEFTFY